MSACGGEPGEPKKGSYIASASKGVVTPEPDCECEPVAVSTSIREVGRGAGESEVKKDVVLLRSLALGRTETESGTGAGGADVVPRSVAMSDTREPRMTDRVQAPE